MMFTAKQLRYLGYLLCWFALSCAKKPQEPLATQESQLDQPASTTRSSKFDKLTMEEEPPAKPAVVVPQESGPKPVATIVQDKAANVASLSQIKTQQPTAEVTTIQPVTVVNPTPMLEPESHSPHIEPKSQEMPMPDKKEVTTTPVDTAAHPEDKSTSEPIVSHHVAETAILEPTSAKPPASTIAEGPGKVPVADPSPMQPIPPVTVTPVPPLPVEKKPSPEEILFKKFEKKIGTYEYSMVLQGDKVGKQKIVVAKTEDGLTVDFDSNMSASFAWGMYTHRYRQTGTETWQGSKLQAMKTATDDNGTKFETSVTSDGVRLTGTGKAVAIATVHPVTTTNLWNFADIYLRAESGSSFPLVDTETGKVTQFRIMKLSDETLVLSGTRINCLHIKFLEDTKSSWEAWFSPTGILMKHKDIVDGGRVIEFILESWN